MIPSFVVIDNFKAVFPTRRQTRLAKEAGNDCFLFLQQLCLITKETKLRFLIVVSFNFSKTTQPFCLHSIIFFTNPPPYKPSSLPTLFFSRDITQKQYFP
jgi:hypothetical protein